MTAGASRDPRPVVVFDFDGVVVVEDSFAGVIRALIRERAWKRALALASLPVALPLLLATRTRSLGARLFFRIAFARVSPADARERTVALARAIAADPRRYHADALTALAAHRQAGERVIVVSGSEETLVRGVLDGLGLPDVEVVASRLDFDGQRVRVLRHCFGAAKPRALAELGVEAWTCAYTDSLADLPLLERAGRAVLINATPSMVRRAARALGRPPETRTWR